MWFSDLLCLSAVLYKNPSYGILYITIMCLSFLDFVFHSQMIDRNSDGKLDLQDFALQGTITNVHYQKWTELRDKFDYDGDGMVTMEEVSALEKYNN